MGGREDRGTHRNMDIPMDGRTDRIQFYKMSAGGKKGWTMDIHTNRQTSYSIFILEIKGFNDLRDGLANLYCIFHFGK